MEKQKIQPPFKMDERNKQIAYKVIAIMYFLTITGLIGVMNYRQFILGQSIGEFEDIAVIITVNSIFLITALLYFGAVPIQRIKISTVLALYAGIVVLGSIFTYAKYNIFLDQNLSIEQLFDKLVIILTISGLIVLFFALFSWLGKKRLEKEIE
jgi:hypothetical protein